MKLTTAELDEQIRQAETERANLEQRQKTISAEIGSNYGSHDQSLEVEYGQVMARLSGLAIHTDNLKAQRAQVETTETLQAYRATSEVVHSIYSQMHSIDNEIKAHQLLIEQLTQKRSKIESEDLAAAQRKRERAQGAAIATGNTHKDLSESIRHLPRVGLYF